MPLSLLFCNDCGAKEKIKDNLNIKTFIQHKLSHLA